MEIEHGLAVVRDAGLATQRIEPATKAERLAWARNRGLAQERLEDLAHSFLGDAEGLELPDDRRERIVTKLRKMLADVIIAESSRFVPMYTPSRRRLPQRSSAAPLDRCGYASWIARSPATSRGSLSMH